MNEILALWVVEGPQRGAVFPLKGDLVHVGRGMDCDVVLTDAEASRRHARISRSGSAWILEDLGSRNGVRVNGVPAARRQLEVGDRISIGLTELSLARGPEAALWTEAKTALGRPGEGAAPVPHPAAGAPAEPFEGMLGSSEEMRKVYALLEKAFGSPAPVLVTGESGTGKELVAKALHANGPCRTGPFVVVHCAALAPGTLESELFGHEKGAFTGAAARRVGRFEWADGGTLFLDEAGEIPMEVQAKLLRVIETGELQRVGGNETIRSRFRLVAATNRDLDAAVKAGRFREDLLYRLRVVHLRLPPLRERRGDVPALAKAFLDRFCRERGVGARRLAPDALALLESHAWPGNVRELRNLVERLTLFHEGEEVAAADLAGLLPSPAAAPAPSLKAKQRDLERSEIERVLSETGWNKKRAAEILGIDRKTLYARIAAWGLGPK